MTSIAVLQPGYLPWLGYFDQIDRVDVFVVYDDVQYDKHGWRNRNRIKGAAGPVWLTIPVRHSGRSGQSIYDVEIDNNQDWRDKHIRSITQLYAKAPFREAYLDEALTVIARPWNKLLDINLAMISLFNRWLGISTQLVQSSTLGIVGERNERLIDICRYFDANHYVSGDAAQSYIDVPLFAAAGIRVEWQDFQHPTYRQLHGGFVSHMSTLDLILNEGATSLEIIRSGRQLLID